MTPELMRHQARYESGVGQGKQCVCVCLDGRATASNYVDEKHHECEHQQ